MRKLIYHVATTLDHYIAHEDHSIEGFLQEGDHVTDYVASFQNYDTVIMGKATYEFGYQYGMEPGQPAYPNMKHYIFLKHYILIIHMSRLKLLIPIPLNLSNN